MNPTGASFCPNIFTDSYTTLLQQVTSKYAAECHTAERMNIYECLMKNAKNNSEDEGILNAFIVEHYEREANNLVKENDECMQKNSKVS
jgi:hypothetical protein